MYYTFAVTFNRDMLNEYSEYMNQISRGIGLMFDTTSTSTDSFKNLLSLADDGVDTLAKFTENASGSFVGINGEKYYTYYTFNVLSSYTEFTLPQNAHYYSYSSNSFMTYTIQGQSVKYTVYIMQDDLKDM